MDAKEYLRRVFQSSALDVTASYLTVRDFVKIFAGEPEAFRAIEQCHFLSVMQRVTLRRLAGAVAVENYCEGED